MGKPTGFMEVARAENPYRDEATRLLDFDDLHIPQPVEARRAQASRCMNCGVPFCQSDFGCPLHNLIPEWNDLLYRGQERAALERLLQMHEQATGSKKAGEILRAFDEYLPRFKAVISDEYLAYLKGA